MIEGIWLLMPLKLQYVTLSKRLFYIFVETVTMPWQYNMRQIIYVYENLMHTHTSLYSFFSWFFLSASSLLLTVFLLLKNPQNKICWPYWKTMCHFLGKSVVHTHTCIHNNKATTQPNMYDYGPWEEAGVHRQDPQAHSLHVPLSSWRMKPWSNKIKTTRWTDGWLLLKGKCYIYF